MPDNPGLFPEYLTEDIYNGLKGLYDVCRSNSYLYVVLVTRRAFNIWDLFYRSSGDSYDTNSIISDNAILLKSHEFAEEYKNQGKFRSFALIDDILVHGRSINKFLQSFASLIKASLKEMDMDADVETIEAALADAIDLWVFVENDLPLLVKQEFQWKIRYSHVWKEKEWRQFSYDVSQLIWHADVANTSYVISAHFDADSNGSDLAHPDWSSVRGTTENISRSSITASLVTALTSWSSHLYALTNATAGRYT